MNAHVLLDVALLVVLVFSTSCQADVNDASRCHLQFVTESSTATTPEQKCGAFFRLVQCNDDAVKTASTEDAALIRQTQDEVAASLGLDCTPYEGQVPAKEPQVYSHNGSLYFEVDESKSVTFVRSRREVITPWSLASELDSTNARVDDLSMAVATATEAQSTERASFLDLVAAMTTQAVQSAESVLSNAATIAEVSAAISNETSRAVTAEESIHSQLDGLSSHVSSKVLSLESYVGAVSNQVVQSAGSLAAAISSMEDAVGDNVDEALGKVSELRTRVESTEDSITSMVSCGVQGQVFNGVGCDGAQAGSSSQCTSESVGLVRAQNGQLKVCTNNDGSFEFVAFSIGQSFPLGSFSNPAPSATAILQANTNAESGLYWIQPANEYAPALTYCDMSFQGGGYMLAAYGHIHSSSSHDRNRAIAPLNHPNGYNWSPGARANSNGVIALPFGAVYLARQAETMLMAAGNIPDSGGIDQYTHVYEISITHVRSHITFKNHNRDNGAVGVTGLAKMTPAQFTVTALRGDSGTRTRYALRESLGVTWSDTYPSGYGFNGCGLTSYCTWGDGPFFPSVHSGDQRCSSSANNFQGADVACGKTNYVHQGWYGIDNGQYNRVGQTSIWFK
ncbi:hypothetical protein PTSG_00460 [Salpingoeca rosetta]|uniref:Fibrinogen C-terminal domain-containing protein n=1 Tax=Salpingoeca rosetta (strain ATCC 50818 / BSB-021) TaxID=946362 RepID=F2TWJ4_SALR5|nr:uncharacterized protein PTSG_00460 [Salpingoeca rosetta]EGD72440.1 hypothetical protein PTSG_00460 [Salpingoeca rosetta]|eukprot:XP_004999009.1 hypothetical protein PTSG_00460 [Salpingoeca rosetta]